MARRIHQLQPPVDPFVRIMRMVLKIFGIVFLLVGLALWGHEIRFGQTAETAVGKIIDVREIQNADGRNYAPVVEYSPQEGRIVHIQGMATSPKPVQGSQVTVLYNRSKPEEGRIDSFAQRWLFPTVFTTIGLMMVLGAVWWKPTPRN